MQTVVYINKLVKRYRELIALDHFSLEIKEGEALGLLGPNGSGKTTAINCLLSLLSTDKGEVEIFGQKMTPTSYEVKRKIGLVPQQCAVFEELTVYENIDYFCGLYVNDKKKRKLMVQEAIDFVDINEFEKFLPKKLSGGLLRRLNIACGIAHRPKLIILDEPTVAVDPQSRAHILKGIKRLNQNGATIIYTSHYMDEVEEICSRIVIMDKGKSLASGTSAELKKMIKIGESIKLSVKSFDFEKTALLEDLKCIEKVHSAAFSGKTLTVKCTHGANNLTSVINLLTKKGIEFTDLYCQQPSLNDVFLEITGKELRDGGA